MKYSGQAALPRNYTGILKLAVVFYFAVMASIEYRPWMSKTPIIERNPIHHVSRLMGEDYYNTVFDQTL